MSYPQSVSTTRSGTGHGMPTWVIMTIAMLVLAAFAVIFLPGIIAQANCNGNPACQTSGTTGNTCFGPFCVAGTSGGTVTIYNTRGGFGQVTANAFILPGSPTATGEVKGSCSWFTCALTGVTVNTIVTVNDATSGTAFRSTSYQFRLGLGDSETYVVSLPSMTNGHQYSVTITETVQTITAGLKSGTITQTVTWPIQGTIQLGSWSS